MVLVAWIMAVSVEHQARRALWSDPGGVPAVDVSDQQASLQPPYLAQQFEPQMWLASGENWNPHGGHLVGEAKQGPELRSALLQRPPGQASRRRVATRLRGIRPDRATARTRVQRAPRGRGSGPVLPLPDVTHRLPHPTDGGTSTLIRYWVFYHYDSLHTWVINQWHQSDWE